MKTPPSSPGTLRLHNHVLSEEGSVKQNSGAGRLGQERGVCAPGKALSFRRLPFSALPALLGSCLWLKQSRPEERIRRNVSFFPIRVVRWGKIAACPPPISITLSKPTTLNHWHESCSRLDRLHSGGGPNVNSRIRVIDADKGIGSQRRSRGSAFLKRGSGLGGSLTSSLLYQHAR